MKSFLDLVNECDNFPYHGSEGYVNAISTYYSLFLAGREGGSGPHGYIPKWVVERMPWGEHWNVDHGLRKVTPKSSTSALASQNELIRDTLNRAREQKIFALLDGWRDELYPIHGHKSEIEDTISMERSGSPLFGVNTYGVHMTIFTRTNDGLHVWVPRRASSKQTYGGMLDNTVAGGLPTGEQPLQCLAREAVEEASLTEELISTQAKACGTVSYVHVRDARAGGETGLLQPECQYVYDLEIGADIKPKPNDKEVEEFYLWSIGEVKARLEKGEFKPNCALVLIDFLVRHGLMTPEDEPNYAEIVSRLHRKLPFPMT